MTPRPIVIDTDPGQDDGLAILLTLASPELSILGITAASAMCDGWRSMRSWSSRSEMVRVPFASSCLSQSSTWSISGEPNSRVPSTWDGRPSSGIGGDGASSVFDRCDSVVVSPVSPLRGVTPHDTGSPGVMTPL
jgi:hypothetical protein